MATAKRVLLRLLAICAVTLIPAQALSATTSHHPEVGIGDDKPDMFADPRFLALGVKTVRYDMHWDALSVGWERKAVTFWMDAAHAHHLDVLVTIDHSDKVIYKKVKVKKKVHGKTVTVTEKKGFSQTRVLPSPTAYSNAFKAFHRMFPWVKNFVTWDETNFKGEATFDKEALVAQYYRALRKDCSSCKILAAEFLDVDKHEATPMATWAKKFVRALGYQPGYWGLNDYEDANHLVTTSTRQLLKAVSGNVWLAETGGIVSRKAHPHADFPQNAAHAAKVDSFVLKTLGSLSPRIQRIYLYEWDAKTRHDSWDTALISYTGAPRESYMVLAKTLYSWGIKPNCSISLVPPTCTGIGAGGSKGPTGASGSTGAAG
ncbi:MAG TPA: hypothetical protein VHX66_06250 [Solirubrobacteraceae bacterium]|jgi:hypothetical protein|nr:hypothetical protein [Solirubrobacteraceae bacterium]